MTKELFYTAGTCEFDDIIANVEPTALVATVELGASDKPLVRGTVLVVNDGKAAPAKAALGNDPVYVLAENVDDPQDGDIVSAYKTGNFVRGRLVADGYSLVAADFEALRKSGIITTGMIEDVDSE